MGDTKTCVTCKKTLPVEEFRFTTTRTAGGRYRASDCRSCHATETRAYRARNIEACRARELAYARAHAEENRARASRYYYARYDSDPIWRLGLLLKHRRTDALKTLANKRSRLGMSE